MLSLEEVFSRLVAKKKELRDIKRSYQDALKNSQQYQEILEEMENLKAKKKALQNELLSEALDKARHEELAVDIKTDNELLTDLVLTKFLAGEVVEVVDDFNVKLVPQFKVSFKKS
ncbi:hypothetical protein KBC55_01275 [Patescibacteria group bacterium]|jgi:hypothetical protein|nr:hypothetical protein [Patescibacteria group bacterium]